MTNIITKKTPATEVPENIPYSTTIFKALTVSAAGLAVASVAAGDTIELFDLPPGARVLDASLRVSGDVADAGGTLQLQTLQGATATGLHTALAATAAGSARMNIAPPAAYTAGATTLRLFVGTAGLDLTSAGTIEANVTYVGP